jgi:fructosamine-3-kinase
MPASHAADDALSAWLADRLGVVLTGRSAVGGGCIHSAWCLRLADGRRLFAKTNARPALPLLQAEAEGLAALAAAAGDDGPLIPSPLALGVAGDEAVLVLRWLALGPGGAAGGEGWQRLGAALARLHRRSLSLACTDGDRPGRACGWPQDNFIGSGPQPNGWDADWGRFFVQRRLAPQLELLARHGSPLERAGCLLEWATDRLARHSPEPAVVHGDLWSGNAAVSADGRGAIFDPAVYRGDREVDLAMARLFGGFPAAFFDGYNAEWPLPADHHPRVDLYNLYHLLNHANLFGGSYRGLCQSAIDRLLAQDSR